LAAAVELVAVEDAAAGAVGWLGALVGLAFGAQDTRNTRMSRETVKKYIFDFIPNLLFMRTR
jgi:hypothetical protein